MSQIPPSTILIVEDTEEYRYLLNLTTKNMGHDCIFVEDGQEALDYLSENVPDLVLLDINMPRVSGMTVLQEIRSNPKFQNVPVIMISAQEEIDTVVKCLEMGADDYISKPFEKTILRARIANILNKRISYKKERELLEKTLVGSVRILSEILETLDPIIFTKISRLKKHCSFLNSELPEKVDRWILEMSAHYSLLGCVYLPKDFVIKAIHGKILAAEERKTFELQTQYGYKILSKIPRLEVIAENIRFMFKNADGTGTPDEVSLKPEELPLGAKILRAAWEYDVLYLKYDNPEQVLSAIKSLFDRLDPTMISLLEKLFFNEKAGEIKEISASNLELGMILAEDVYTRNDIRIAGKWQEITETLYEKIISLANIFGIKEPLKVIFPRKTF